jgi:hypothetical protein
MRDPTKIFENSAIIKIVDNVPNSLIGSQVLHTFVWWLFSSNELLIVLIAAVLYFTNSVNEFPQCTIVHAKFCLHPPMSGFNVVVSAIITTHRDCRPAVSLQ